MACPPCGSSPLARGTPLVQRRRQPGHRFIPARAGNTTSSPPSARTATVHPRSRGEHVTPNDIVSTLAGSSPLARGTHPRRPRGPGRCRFIPARAGNTRPGRGWRGRRPVHPRSRGEHSPPPAARTLRAGSSPLARGTPPEGDLLRDVIRFIPARAGNTRPGATPRRRTPVHPRSRGEHQQQTPVEWYADGSSPLARGTRRAAHRVRPHRRFIPARAGNTGSAPRARGTGSVHPRSRGEHPPPAPTGGRCSGSSPLARGTLDRLRPRPRAHRFIPARAGNTVGTARLSLTRPVHPRSRGEHVDRAQLEDQTTGSSPLARGTPRRRHHAVPGHRFIPARAGNTPIAPPADSSTSVHPRSRGEHWSRPKASSTFSGSSPLARGTRERSRRDGGWIRFIPARAGNTIPIPRCQSCNPVHPRSRGEHSCCMKMLRFIFGSSPLARGTRGANEQMPVADRFIPARAGNT